MHPLITLGWDDSWAESVTTGLPGRVVVEHRGAYVLATADGEVWAEASGKLFRDDRLPATGDWVSYEPGEPRGIIQDVLPRRSKLSRQHAGRATGEQVLVANVDTVFCVTALTDELNARRMERYLATVWSGGAQPVVVCTKTDIATQSPDELDAVAAGVPIVVTSAVTGEGYDELGSYLQPGRTIALIGSSGVGKSSIVNRLLGEDRQAVSHVRADGKGRHTTVTRELIALPSGALLLDTPGLRELQLWDADLDTSFSDIDELASGCRFNDCTHTREPGCAVRAALDDGTLDAARYASMRKLERELAHQARRQNALLAMQERKRWRTITRQHRGGPQKW